MLHTYAACLPISLPPSSSSTSTPLPTRLPLPARWILLVFWHFAIWIHDCIHHSACNVFPASSLLMHDPRPLSTPSGHSVFHVVLVRLVSQCSQLYLVMFSLPLFAAIRSQARSPLFDYCCFLHDLLLCCVCVCVCLYVCMYHYDCHLWRRGSSQHCGSVDRYWVCLGSQVYLLSTRIRVSFFFYRFKICSIFFLKFIQCYSSLPYALVFFFIYIHFFFFFAVELYGILCLRALFWYGLIKGREGNYVMVFSVSTAAPGKRLKKKELISTV